MCKPKCKQTIYKVNFTSQNVRKLWKFAKLNIKIILRIECFAYILVHKLMSVSNYSIVKHDRCASA